MLVELSISNVAIIESLRLEFSSGLIVLTGETGAGKSIIIDAVSLLLGGRAPTEIIRTGCESATIEGVFFLSPQLFAVLRPFLQEQGLFDDSNELILRREISRGRRNVCRVNGRAVTLTTLQEIGEHLIDIHGQGEHLSLMQTRRHVDFLDRYGGLMRQREAFAALAATLHRVRGDLSVLRQDERELARRTDLLAFQIEEIEAANLRDGEESELKQQRSLLASAEKRLRLSAQLHELLAEGDEGQRAAADALGSATEIAASLAELDESLREESQAVESVLYQVEELARSIRKYRDAVEYDPQSLEEIEERLQLIQSLKRKYGDSIRAILGFAEEARRELDGITHSEERLEALRSRERVLLGEIAALGQKLSAERREAAERLCRAVEGELAELNMDGAQFLIDVRWSPNVAGVGIDGASYAFDATGLDQVEFLIGPNPGEEPKPMVKIASGGETSRLMLAMKAALSSIDLVPTLIFDEIDAGIGGQTGSIVGQKLWNLARDHQVFCVTHLAQLARYAEHHFLVTKDVVQDRTLSSARLLAHEERVQELAILLGGAATETTRRSAEELLQRPAAS